MSAITLRPAVAADQPVIRQIVRTVQINPLQLHWPHFVVAENEQGIVGIGQIKVHRDGSPELASLGVLPPYQAQGIGGRIIAALLEHAQPPLYLLCLEPLGTYYARWGFRRVDGNTLPRSVRREYRLGTLVALLQTLVGRREVRLVAMRWESRSDAG